MIEINKLKPTVWIRATKTVIAIFGRKKPGVCITVKPSETAMVLIEDVGLEVMPANRYELHY